MAQIMHSEMTNSIGTEDWLETSKGMVISAFIGQEASPLTEGYQTFTRADFERDLRKVSRKLESSNRPSSVGRTE